MAFHVTQCPGCESTFSATARILESASGQVRCGACLTIFDAIEHFVIQQDANGNNTDEESVFLGNNPQDYFDPSIFLSRASLTEPDNYKEKDSKDDLIQTNDAIGSPSNTSNFSAHNSTDPEIQESWGAPDDAKSFCEQPKELDKNPLKSYQKNVLLDRNADNQALDKIFAHKEAQKEFESAVTAKIAEPQELEESSAKAFQEQQIELPESSYGSSFENDSEFDPAFETVDDESTEFPIHANQLTGGENYEHIRKNTATRDESQLQDNIEEVDQSTEAIRARALENELEDEEAFEIISEEHLKVLDQVVPPLELTTKRNIDWFRRITLTFVGIFLGGVLFAQYLIQNTHIYSQQTEFRQFYIIVCNFLQCDLPMFSNIAAIRSDNLTVRSHLEAENALTVNIAFRNTADFPQAFPILVLSFNTVNNDIVALREFAPTEYLDVGLRAMTMMPVMSPVQINLELVDPGPDAVNYTIAFRRP